MKWWHNRSDDRLQYEFLPSALEITETPASPFGRVVIWFIVALMAIALVWSYVGRVDVVAVSQGKIVPVGDVKTIQSVNGGVINSIRVSEGDSVEKGQLLVELDSTLATAEVKALEKSLATVKLERDILRKTLVGEDVSRLINNADISEDTKGDLLELAKSQSSASRIRRQFLSMNTSRAQSQLDIEQQNLNALQASLQAAQNRKQQLEAEIRQASGTQQATLQAQLQQLNSQIADMQDMFMAQHQRTSQAQAAASEASSSLSNFEAEAVSSIMTRVVEQSKQITELEDGLAKAIRDVELMSIKSPVGGTVLSISSNTIGGVVATGQPLITIVPAGTPLVVEALLQNKDVGFVHEGQKVAIKVDAYSFQRHGYLTGKIKSISPDTFDDEKLGAAYKVKITINDNHTSKDSLIEVSPGMSVASEIITGKRRIIEFFFDPFITHTNDSLKVR